MLITLNIPDEIWKSECETQIKASGLPFEMLFLLGVKEAEERDITIEAFNSWQNENKRSP
jgi:hypothetical protein